MDRLYNWTDAKTSTIIFDRKNSTFFVNLVQMFVDVFQDLSIKLICRITTWWMFIKPQ